MSYERTSRGNTPYPKPLVDYESDSDNEQPLVHPEPGPPEQRPEPDWAQAFVETWVELDRYKEEHPYSQDEVNRLIWDHRLQVENYEAQIQNYEQDLQQERGTSQYYDERYRSLVEETYNAAKTHDVGVQTYEYPWNTVDWEGVDELIYELPSGLFQDFNRSTIGPTGRTQSRLSQHGPPSSSTSEAAPSHVSEEEAL